MPYQDNLVKFGLVDCFRGNWKLETSPRESPALKPYKKWGRLSAQETIDSKEAARRYNGIMEVNYFDRKDRA